MPKSNLQLSITKRNRKVTEGIGSITVQKQHQVDSPLGREISWEAAMTGFANLFNRPDFEVWVSAIIMTGRAYQSLKQGNLWGNLWFPSHWQCPCICGYPCNWSIQHLQLLTAKPLSKHAIHYYSELNIAYMYLATCSASPDCLSGYYTTRSSVYILTALITCQLSYWC